jgi:hypothetical protein
MKDGLVCQGNIDYRLKESMQVKIIDYSLTGRKQYPIILAGKKV